MKRCARNWRIWALVGLGLILVSLVPVFARLGDTDLTATPYADVIRFEAAATVESLQITVYDLSGRELWDSGVIPGNIIDWDRTNDWGERLAYGNYLYKATGWDGQGSAILDRSGKLALLPGDKVQLQAAPAISAAVGGDEPLPRTEEIQVLPMGLGDTGIFGKVGIGTSSPICGLDCRYSNVVYKGQVIVVDTAAPSTSVESSALISGWGSDIGSKTTGRLWYFGSLSRGNHNIALGNQQAGNIAFWTNANERMVIHQDGNVGIGTDTPAASLQVEGDDADLLALYDVALPGDAKFRVENDGDVYADGTYYSSDGAVHVGSADVAERINTSEWVEPGSVVEIDPDHPGFFRKATDSYSTKVAGIVSTSPGVILGNNFDASIDKWDDNRPMLAIAGRVPVKATTENGAIQVGDLLVSSSVAGVAMKGTDQLSCLGAVIGKAMEPLDEGSGVIMVQVMLR
jgi:hypothetical protein